MIDLDDINRDILDLLQHDGRISYRELGERVGLTAPAVTERVRKLEEQGVIKGYRAVVDYETLGFPLLCVIRLNSPRGAHGVDEIIREIPEVRGEAHPTTSLVSLLASSGSTASGHRGRRHHR